MKPVSVMLAGLLACSEGPSPETPASEQPEASSQTETAPRANDSPPSPSPPASEPAPSDLQPPTSAIAPDSIGTLQPEVPTRITKTPVPTPSSEALTKTEQRLTSLVETHGTDPANPWAIGHALLALGPDLVLNNDKRAVEWLFEQYAVRLTADGHSTVQFPRSAGSTRIEPHKQLFLKVFTEVGVSPDRPVTVQGQPHTVGDLYRGALLGTWLVPAKNHSSFSSPNDMPWAVQALAAWAPTGPLTWSAVDGTTMALDDLATFTTSVLVAESQPLFEAMQAGAELRKRKQGVFGYTCGGSHLLQSTAYAVARGRSTELARQAIQGQVALHFWRLSQELRIYDDAAKRAPQHSRTLLVQRLKFLGHWLETAHKLAILNFYSPTTEQQRQMAGAAQQLALTVEALSQEGAINDMPRLKTAEPQLYLDLIGDSAHALYGLQLAMGTRGLRW